MVAPVLWGVLGSAVGSFLNVVIHRVPLGRSVISPASACGSCGHGIRWFDNIPVLSWAVLRGRCRDCAGPISVRYPLIELAGAGFFALVAIRFAPSLESGFSGEALAAWGLVGAYQFLAAASIALAAIDLETRRLPNSIVLPTAIVGVTAFAILGVVDGDPMPVLGSLLGGLAMMLLYALPAWIKPGSMGLGDVKLAGAIGLYLGWLGLEAWTVGVIAGFLVAGLVGASMLAIGRRGATVALGPWMLMGAWVGILAGSEIATAYLGWFGLH